MHYYLTRPKLLTFLLSLLSASGCSSNYLTNETPHPRQTKNNYCNYPINTSGAIDLVLFEKILNSTKYLPGDSGYRKLNDFGVYFAVNGEYEFSEKLLQAAISANSSSSILYENIGNVFLLMARHQYSKKATGLLRQLSTSNKLKIMENYSSQTAKIETIEFTTIPPPPLLQDSLLRFNLFSKIETVCSEIVNMH
jgi:hypothetical protein